MPTIYVTNLKAVPNVSIHVNGSIVSVLKVDE